MSNKIVFPFRKILKRFDMSDFPDQPDDYTLPKRAADNYAVEARKGLMITGLTEFFGIIVRAAKHLNNTHDVWLESHDHIKGEMSTDDLPGGAHMRFSWFQRRSREDNDE